MSAIVNTGLTEAALRSEFFQRYTDAPSLWRDFVTIIPSTRESENYRWLGSVPLMREWGTGRLSRGIRSEHFDVRNERYECTISVDKIELEDDQTEQLRQRINELASRVASHRDFLVSELLANGGEAGFLAYDGKPFFSDDHESGDSGVQSNKLTAEAVDPSDPSPTEFRAALKTAISGLLSLRDDVGSPVSMTASGLVCVVPPKMLFSALETVNASLVQSTTNVLAGAARVVAFPWLTGPKWYLLKTDQHPRPLIYQNRAEVEFTALEQNSETGFLKEVFLYGTRYRGKMTYGRWELAVSTEFVELEGGS